MDTKQLGLSRQRRLLDFLFSTRELLKLFSNIWIFLILEFGLFIAYVQFNVNSLLIISLSYLFVFFVSLVLYKKYQEAKEILFNRYTEIRNMISQELLDGEKLTNWQNELEVISDFLEQQGLLKKATTLLRE